MTSFWEILKSSKNLKASDAFAELWGKSIADSWDIITITGSLPLSFLSKGEALTNYRIHGTSEGVGEKTKNLFDKNDKDTDNGYVSEKYLLNTGDLTTGSGNLSVSEYISVEPNTLYTLNVGTAVKTPSICFYDSNKTYISGTKYANNQILSVTTPQNCAFVRMSYYSAAPRYVCLCKGDTTLDNIPFGYQIPLTVTSGEQSDTYPLYIGSTKLGEEEYVDYESGKIYRIISGTPTPTDPPAPFPAITVYKGENTLSSTETVGEVSVTGKIKEI